MSLSHYFTERNNFTQDFKSFCFLSPSTPLAFHVQEEDEDPGELREVVKTFHFPCSRWLARDEEDGEIVVELMAEDYEDLEGMERESNHC